MSQVIQHSPVDVVILGMGAMSGTVAVELSTAGYKTVGLERGPSWDYISDYFATKYDEWGIGFMRKFDHPLPVSSVSFRNNRFQYALPIRRYTAGIAGQIISEGHGVGGMCQHYGGLMGRYAPWVYEMYSQTVNKYGTTFLDNAVPHHDIQDWPMTYDDYLPYYKEWEQMWGVSGTDQEPFMPDSTYPLPPAPDTPIGTAFKNAATSLGYTPFPVPSALTPQAFVNKYGVAVEACAFDGWCGAPCNYVCETGAKASSAVRTVPAALKTGNLDLRLHSWVYRLDTDSSGKVTAARYYDAQGNVNVQPGKVFFNGIWGYNVTRLMYLSGIGNPYDPVNISGSLGRGPAPGVPGAAARSVSGTLDNIGENAYPAGNAEGGQYAMLDLADDNFDHTGLDFIGGAYVRFGGYSGGPENFNLYANAPSPNTIGSTFKSNIKDAWLVNKVNLNVSPYGMWPPTTDWFFDLDPHYTDRYGDPLSRVTMDWGGNTTKCSNYLAPKFVEILQKMGASNVTMSPTATPNANHQYSWPAHIRGGARLGSDPSTSVFNKWQQCWASENLFAAGEVCDPTGDNTTTGGTHPVGPTSYVAAEGIKKYLQSPGPLVSS
jgi:gluconate 2-dehydrogenase alpha chain